MHFDYRELTAYSEPLSAEDLIEGDIYFFLTFADDDMLLPSLEPVVFIGGNLGTNETGTIYFQDIESYQQGIRHNGSNSEVAVFYSGSAKETGHVFEYEHALEELMRCSIRRKRMITG